MKLIFIQFFILFCLFAKIYPTNVKALSKEGLIVYEKTNPDAGFLYKIKRFREKSYLTYLKKFKPQEVTDYYFVLINKRFRELKYVVEKNKLEFLETSVTRYNSQIGEVIDITNEQGIDIQTFQPIIEIQREIMPDLRDKYPANSAQWLLLQQSLDILNSLI